MMRRCWLIGLAAAGLALAQEHGTAPAAGGEKHGAGHRPAAERVADALDESGPVSDREEAAAHGQEHDGNLIYWKWANFALLVGVLAYMAKTQGGPALRAREEDIRAGLEAAALAQRDAEARSAEVQRRLGALDSEIAALQAQGQEQIQTEASRIQAETRRLVERVQQQAMQEIQLAQRAAQAELRLHAGRLALRLAEEKVRQQANADTDRILIDGFVAHLHSQPRPEVH